MTAGDGQDTLLPLQNIAGIVGTDTGLAFRLKACSDVVITISSGLNQSESEVIEIILNKEASSESQWQQRVNGSVQMTSTYVIVRLDDVSVYTDTLLSSYISWHLCNIGSLRAVLTNE